MSEKLPKQNLHSQDFPADNKGMTRFFEHVTERSKRSNIDNQEESTLKATGIVRRIDDLGRVVIPKEIRRTLRIREGDALEIFTDAQGALSLKIFARGRNVYLCWAVCRGSQ